MRRKALNNVQLKNMLTETFGEMISEGWIETVVEKLVHDNGCWYLPSAVALQLRPPPQSKRKSPCSQVISL